MASGSARRVYSSTLTASTVDVVLITEGAYGVQVTNVDGSAPIWFTVSTQGGACPVPTVNGTNGEYCAASVAGNFLNVRHDAQFGSVVQLISSGTPQYTVGILGYPASM